MTDARRDLLSIVGLGLAALVGYALMAPSALCGADNPEFATLMVRPGAAHPPGYPLYTIYLRLMSWMPGTTTAHSAALATSLLGGSTVAVLVAAGLRWGASRRAAMLGAALVAVELHVFGLHTHAEVFALNNFIAAAFLYVAAPGGGQPLARAAALGVLGGLGLANHHSIVMLAPLGIWAVVRAVRDAESKPAAIALLAAGTVLGLSPYLALFAVPDDCVNCLAWGRFDGIADIGHHFLRRDYGTTSLGIGGVRDPVAHLLQFGEALARGSWLLVPVLGAAGLVVTWKRDHVQALILGATVLCSGPVFVSLFNVEPIGIGAEIVARFYALPVVASAPLVMLALNRLRPRQQLVALPLIIALATFNGTIVVKQCTGVLNAYVQDVLEPLPERAIVFGTGDHRTFGAAYMQQVEGLRPDVDWVDGKMLAHAWYVERLEKRLGRELPRSTPTDIPIAEFVVAAQQTGRPVFATHIFAEALRSFPSYPIGPVIRLLAPDERPADPRDLAARNAELLDELRLNTPISAVRSAWELEVYTHYARPWASLADVFDQLGDIESAARARAMASVYDSGPGAHQRTNAGPR